MSFHFLCQLRFFFVLLVLFNRFGAVELFGGSDFGQINFGGAPNLNDEESSGFHMPDALKCDACHVISYMIFESFQKDEKKLASTQKELTESQVIDAVDRVCSSDFNNYGVTEIGGRKRFKGPGLDTEGVPGVSQSGGKWPGRFSELCFLYAGDLGEDFLYRKYRRSAVEPRDALRRFRKFLCEESGTKVAYCSKKKEEF